MTRKLPTWLTCSERKRMLAVPMSERDRAIVTTLLYAGLRSNELRMLNIEDLDFEENTVFVRYGKRAKERILPLHPESAGAIWAYLVTRCKKTEKLSGPVFLNRFGQRISNRALRRLVKQVGQQAGLRKNIHPHALRHSFAVFLLDAGVDLEMIRDLLGHDHIQTTSIYLHCSTARRRTAINLI